jgi:endonuclease G, mitochondrial
MPVLSPAQQHALLDLLLELPSTRTAEQRQALLFGLPAAIQDTERARDRLADLAEMIQALEYWGQLADGRWATEAMLRNAKRSVRQTAFEPRLEAFIQGFELPAAQARLEPLPELIASDVSYLMPVGFLAGGHRASLAVARLAVPRFQGAEPVMGKHGPSCGKGTGWMIAPALMITNHHVVEARFSGEGPATADEIARQAAGTQIWFDYTDADKPVVVHRVAGLEAMDARLDYAILRLEPASTPDGRPLAEWGVLRIAPPPVVLTPGRPLNIIQHPGGELKQIAIRRNDYVGPAAPPWHESQFYYLTDTLNGSSGSPVLDDDWQVVGLHRASRTLPEAVSMKGEAIKYNNVGVHIHAILDHVPPALRDEIAAAGA